MKKNKTDIAFRFMKFCSLNNICFFLFGLCPAALVSGNTNDLNAYYVQGLSFTKNEGQYADIEGNYRPDILYKGSIGGVDFYVRKTGISYVQQKTDPFPDHPQESDLLNLSYYTHRVDLDFVNSNSNSFIKAADPLDSYKNYYYPHCPQGVTEVKSYNTLIHKNIYPNIDVIYKGNKQGGLKYDIVVNPGGNPENIILKYSGAEEVKIENNHLIIKTSIGKLVEYMPKVYQYVNGKIIDVKARYILDGLIVGIQLDNYDAKIPLVIDPWITYFGGSGYDQALSVTTLPSGDIAFMGTTNSSNFPVLGAYQGTLSANIDAFCAKMSDDGNLYWSTYYGGSHWEAYGSITSDNNGDVYFAGDTKSSNFPTGASLGQTTFLGVYPGKGSAYIVKLNASGQRLWATYYGHNSEYTSARDLVIDNNNELILYGDTKATSGIATSGTFQPTKNSGNDLYIAKFTSAGNRLWGTYCGGTENEYAGGVVCASSGDIYISGTTKSTSFPVTGGAHQVLYGGGSSDMFLCKFTPAGQRTWATYYGGSRAEGEVTEAGEVEVDSYGNVYLAGSTASDNRIATPGAYQAAKALPGTTDKDAFLAKFSAAGTRLWGTYIGGTTGPGSSSGKDYVTGIAIVNNENVVIAGDTYSVDFPVTSCAAQTEFYGTEDQFITTFDLDGNMVCSGFLGEGPMGVGPDNETEGMGGGAIASSGSSFYLVGHSSCNYPVTQNAYQQLCGGSDDAFIARLCSYICGLMEIEADFNADRTILCNVGDSVNFALTNTTCDQTGTSYLWSFSGASPSTSTSQNPQGVVYTTAGLHDVKVIISTPCETDSVVKKAYINVAPLVAYITGDTEICIGQATTLTAQGGTSYLWNTGETSNEITVSPQSDAIYSLTVTDNTINCTVTITHSITVSTSLPTAVISGISPVCEGNATTLTASGGIWYYWSTGSTNNAITVFPTTITSYSLVAYNSCGENSSTVEIAVLSLPQPEFVSDLTEGCSPVCINFTNTTPETQRLSWNLGDGNTSELQNPYNCYTQQGSYTISLTVTDNNGCINTITKSNYITVHPNPIAIFEAKPKTAGLFNATILFTDHSEGAVAWQWKFNENDEAYSFLRHPSYTYDDTGCYKVTLIVQNQYTCVDSAATEVCITPEFIIYAPNTFTPDNDGINDIFQPKGMNISHDQYLLQIFDRWGNLIFESHDPSAGWDGRANGGKDIAQVDTYVWKINLMDMQGQKHQYIGHVNLLR